MKLLNSTHFNTLVDYYGLHKEINYYKLYNKSKYINSYHGYTHVRNVICSIYELTKTIPEWHYSEIRRLLVAAIFHDFDYVGVDLTNPLKYDSININKAIDSYKNYCQINDIKYDIGVTLIIIDSEYPVCKIKQLNIVSDLFVQADHSMVIHNGYPYMGLMYAIQECGCTNQHQIMNNALPYFDSLQFKNEHFQAIWTHNKREIIRGFKNIVNEYCSVKRTISEKDQSNDWYHKYWQCGDRLTKGYFFELVTSNY